MKDSRHSKSITTADPDIAVETLSANRAKRRLTIKFLLTGFFATILIVTALTTAGYYVVRSWALQSTAEHVADEIRDNIVVRVRSDQSLTRPKAFEKLGTDIAKLTRVNEVGIYDANRKLLWPTSGVMPLSKSEAAQFALVSQGSKRVLVFDRNFLSADSWRQLISGDSYNLPALVSLLDANDEQLGVVKIVVDSKQDLVNARIFGIGLFVAMLLAMLLLFYLLYQNFKRGVQTIKEQEDEMNLQIKRLSNLLIINKNMQKSIKTASARGVELNEQFLRRTGADLHDGPAQMIGFAAMRLNKLSKDEAVKSLGQEFHTIRDALDQSLDEIRGISSGLVLPELASISFEQCLRKVVMLHGTKSDAEVSQFHAQVPEDIPLPIKICAYRFLQEGLNNAERHGKAEKCRLSTSYRNGTLEVSLKDNGMGFRKSQLNTDGVHLGLIGMKDRIESIGGTFNINSELGVGTALKFSVDMGDDT